VANAVVLVDFDDLDEPDLMLIAGCSTAVVGVAVEWETVEVLVRDVPVERSVAVWDMVFWTTD
jgi:hypothetical protein